MCKNISNKQPHISSFVMYTQRDLILSQNIILTNAVVYKFIVILNTYAIPPERPWSWTRSDSGPLCPYSDILTRFAFVNRIRVMGCVPCQSQLLDLGILYILGVWVKLSSWIEMQIITLDFNCYLQVHSNKVMNL